MRICHICLYFTLKTVWVYNVCARATRTNVKPYKYAWTDWFQAISTQSNLRTTFEMKHIIYIEIIYYIYTYISHFLSGVNFHLIKFNLAHWLFYEFIILLNFHTLVWWLIELMVLKQLSARWYGTRKSWAVYEFGMMCT